jgi:hypothetical protein
MQFPARNFTLQYVSSSYQSIVQCYDNYDDYVYLLDGNGYVLLCVLSSSLYQPIITQNQTISQSISSSYAQTYQTEFVTSMSYANYADTSETSVSSSYSLISEFSDTASYLNGAPHVEKGIVSGSVFSNSPQSLQITYNNPFDDNNYVVSIIGDDARLWTANNRTTSSFVINSNSSQPLVGMVMWRVEEI